MKWFCLLTALMVAFGAGCKEDESAPVIEYYQVGESIEEYTCDELAGLWWQWALTIPAATSPLRGGDCTQNQAGDVFFLAGNQGGTETRSCTVPSGASIFFPILNTVYVPCPEVWGTDVDCRIVEDASMMEAVTGFYDYEVALEVELNGRPMQEDLTGFTCTSEMFDVVYTSTATSLEFYEAGSVGGGMPLADTECLDPWEAGNVCGADPGPKRTMGAGYWVALKPPEPGEHTIRISGVVNPADPWFTLDVTYNLTVAAP